MAVFNKNKFSKFLYMPHLVTQYSTEDWVVEQAQLFEVCFSLGCLVSQKQSFQISFNA